MSQNEYYTETSGDSIRSGYEFIPLGVGVNLFSDLLSYRFLGSSMSRKYTTIMKCLDIKPLSRRMMYCRDNEGSIAGGVTVTYKGVEYVTGNRYHDLVELYQNGKFCFVVRCLKNFTFRKL